MRGKNALVVIKPTLTVCSSHRVSVQVDIYFNSLFDLSYFILSLLYLIVLKRFWRKRPCWLKHWMEMVSRLQKRFNRFLSLTTSKSYPSFSLFHHSQLIFSLRASTWQFLVPENLRSIKFEVRGKVKPFTSDSKTVISAKRTFEVNSQDESTETGALYLSYSKNGICLHFVDFFCHLFSFFASL